MFVGSFSHWRATKYGLRGRLVPLFPSNPPKFLSYLVSLYVDHLTLF